MATETFDVFGIFDHTLPAGGAQADRSIYLGNGNHFHGWGFFVSQRGIDDVSMRVYDTTGTYAASDVFTFQINSIPGPSGAAVLGALAMMRQTQRGRSK